MSTWWHDFRHGARLLWKSPGFTLVAVLSLAIGIGANSALFSVTDALLLRPLPYDDSERIAILWQRSPGLNIAQDWFSLGQYLDIKADNRSFTQVGAAIGASFNMTGDSRPERIDGARVSASLFAVLGVRPARGRLFTAEDETPGHAPVVILTDGFWKRRFGADPGVVGTTITLNGNSLAIVGVMPPGFVLDKEVMPTVNGVQRVNLLLPLPISATARANRGGEDFNLFAKLRPGVSSARAQSDMDLLAGRMKAQYPANYPSNGGLTISVVPLLNQVVGDVRLALYVLLGAVAFVLLIACGNVANLLLARAAIREKEIAIRTAVGASRAQIIRQLLAESSLLAIAGGALGLVLALVAIQSLRSFGPANIPRLHDISIDGRVLLFTFIVALVTGVAFGLVPALRASRTDPGRVLKEGGRGTAGVQAFGIGHDALRKLLISAEVALSLVLLVGAGLLIRSYERITSADPGFNPHHVLSLRVSLPNFRYKTPESVSAFYRDLGTRIRALPGVQYVGSNYQLPLSAVALAWEPIGIEGHVPKAAGDELIIASSAYISSDYFRAMGIALLSGRSFDERDTRQSTPVVMVDDKLATRFWPNESPIGKRLRQGADGPWREVVGVVADRKQYAVDAEPPITAFFPVDQINIPSRYIVVRTTGNAASLAGAVAGEIRALDAELPAYDVRTMEDRLHDSLARRRLSMLLLGTFALCALLLAAIGIFGVINYWVNQRTREIGIRVALGADGRRIVVLVWRQTLTMVGVGLVAGLAASLALTRVMNALLFGVSATDLATFATVPFVLAAVALVATHVPTRRALRIQPMAALRQE